MCPIGPQMLTVDGPLDIAVISKEDGPQVSAIKVLMNRMTAYNRRDRPKMAAVVQELLQIQSKHSYCLLCSV